MTMKKALILATALAGLASQGSAQALDALSGNYWTTGGTVVVSCYRGPWRDVIWDRPEGVFIESLVTVGYDYPSALAIATRVCRDRLLVGDLDGMKREMERIIAEAPRP
jgi:hypothetical protein